MSCRILLDEWIIQILRKERYKTIFILFDDKKDFQHVGTIKR